MSELFLCRANGEGSHQFRVCADEDEVRKFYGEMFGEDTVDDFARFRDPEEWSNGGTAYHEELYCATFDCWKVDRNDLTLPAAHPIGERPDTVRVPKKLIALSEKATPYHDVEVMWYHYKDIGHPQFETDKGGIAQEKADYEFYCAAVNWVRSLLSAAEKSGKDGDRG